MNCNWTELHNNAPDDGRRVFRCRRCGGVLEVHSESVDYYLSQQPECGQTKAYFAAIVNQHRARREQCGLPGTRLHEIIARFFGQLSIEQCGCKSRISKMNGWGTKGCREHLEEIVAWLVREAETHKWVVFETDESGAVIETEKTPPRLVRLNRWLMKYVRGGAKPTEVLCRQMVLWAIRRAEKIELSHGRITTCPS